MKSYKCLMGVMLSAVLLFGSAFAANTLNKDDAIKSSKIVKSISPNINNRDECSDSFMVYGSDLSGAYYGACWSDGSGYFSFEWTGGCIATSITYSAGTLDLTPYGFDAGFFFYGFDPGVTEVFEMAFNSGSTGDGAATSDCATCEELGQITCWDGSCADTLADCPEEGDCGAGYVIDCVDTDCCLESWIGDGYGDCEDQAYGCDLTCYDNDGGDCAPTESCEDQGLVTCADGSCAATADDCPDTADCDAAGGLGSWISDGYCDGNNNIAECDYDGGDCCPCTCVDSTDYDCATYGGTCDDCIVDGDASVTCPDDCAPACPGQTECWDGTCVDDPADCSDEPACPDGYVQDCVDDDCCLESWIGDGFEDCEDQAFGCDLTCYDNDGGDCPEACENYTCWDGSCVASEADCPDQPEVPDPEGVCIAGEDYAGYPAVTVSWNINTECGDGICNGDEDYINCDADCDPSCADLGQIDCPDGSCADSLDDCPDIECTMGVIVDCVGQVGCNEDAVYTAYDCLVDNGECFDVNGDGVITDWIGDTYCDDGAFGWDFNCEEFNFDDGDCEGSGTTGGGTADCESCDFDFTDYGAECCDVAWDAFGVTCAELESIYYWDCSGCICPGDGGGCEDEGLVTCWDGSCAATADDCPEQECPAGTIADCSGDGDCGYDTWLGDGYCDGSSQQYGIDNCCYDLDGGDCTEEECAGGRAQVAYEFKKGSEPTMLQNGRLVDMIKAEKQSTKSLRDGVVVHGSQAVRFNEIIDNPSSRALTATVALSCEACLDGGPWSGEWLVAAMDFGYFTVYGFDAGADVCGTVTFCEDTNGACSETSEEVCAVAGDADSVDCVEGGSDCPSEAGSGDVNADGDSNVLDIVTIVNVILGGEFADDCAAAAADVNGDGEANVLDIVQIVNGILGRSDVGDATTGKLIRDNGALFLKADGYIGGVQMTLSHDGDFSIELSEAWLAESQTTGNMTTLVIVNHPDKPMSDELFTYTGDFEIVEMIVANSQDRVNVGAPTEFSLSTAYPNPFNPTTSLELSVPMNGQVTVQVYNLMGQVVATLANGYMDASTYTLTWDASNVSSGMYIVKAEAAGTVSTQKLMLMK